jgi:hypothetical protein
VADQPLIVLLNGGKHLAREGETRTAADETPYAVARSFATLRMTKPMTEAKAPPLNDLKRVFVVVVIR